MTILAEKKPKTVEEERQLIGFLSYYRRYIPQFCLSCQALVYTVKQAKICKWIQAYYEEGPNKTGMASYHLQHQLCGQKTINSQ